MTREEWLMAATELVAPLFDGVAERNPVRVSVGFPAGRGSLRTTIGQCHYMSEDGIPQLFIHPKLTDPIKVLDVLVHELCHAYLPVGSGHGKEFGKVARAVGLEGKLTATDAGEDLRTDLEQIVEVLGEYPHAGLDAASIKKQGTRMIKCECQDCGFVYRTTAKWLDAASGLRCPDVECYGMVTVG